jgi:hypothetical protein
MSGKIVFKADASRLKFLVKDKPELYARGNRPLIEGRSE